MLCSCRSHLLRPRSVLRTNLLCSRTSLLRANVLRTNLLCSRTSMLRANVLRTCTLLQCSSNVLCSSTMLRANLLCSCCLLQRRLRIWWMLWQETLRMVQDAKVQDAKVWLLQEEAQQLLQQRLLCSCCICLLRTDLLCSCCSELLCSLQLSDAA